MSRTMQCANVQSLGNAHSHITPEGHTNNCTLPAQNSLKALASAVLGRTLPRTLPAQSEKTACTLPAQSTPECSAKVLLSDVHVDQAETEPITACSTCSHLTGRGGCGEPVFAGLSNLDGVIRYHGNGGEDCLAWLAIIPDDLEALK